MCPKMMLLSKRLKSLFETNSTLFISDLHLSAQEDALQDLFFNFVKGPALMAEKIYVLGDLFDIWVGKDIQTPFHNKVAAAFKTLHNKGISLYFMAGNRDFLLQRDFLIKSGLQKLSDPSLISLYGKPMLLTHGDKLCTQDIAYQRYRKIAQHPITQKFFLLLPRKTRLSIAEKLRHKSKQYQQHQHHDILDVTPGAVQDIMQRFKVPYLLHGHVHRPQFHQVEGIIPNGHRFVLGDWHQKGSFIISSSTEIKLATFSHQQEIDILARYAF